MKKDRYYINSSTYPLLGIISLMDYDENIIVTQIKNVSDTLKQVKGFGDLSLGKATRNMLSIAIVALAYADYLNEENNICNITNNIILDIVIYTQITCMMTAISVSSAL